MTAARIVVFGAAGYTGRLVTESLVRGGARPVVAGRNLDAVRRLAAEHGDLPWAVADAIEPATVRALVGAGDVLVSTVGPFGWFGAPAVEAAIDAGAHYVDSTGEIAFLRRVWDDWGPRAARAGVALLPAFGYDFVPGNLAGALALEAAAGSATAVDIGYFLVGRGRPSSGTLATLALSAGESAVAWRDGRLVEMPALGKVRSFPCDGRQLAAGAVGGSEHLALPRSYPRLRDVGVYLGWLGPAVHLARLAAPIVPLVLRPSVRTAVVTRAVRRSGEGLSPEERRGVGSRVLAVASDDGGHPVATARVEGVDPYTLTGQLMAWAARRLAAGAVGGAGALGPVGAFGLEALTAGARAAGLERIRAGTV